MQSLPVLPVDGLIEIAASNRSQQRGVHGAFRYFGKLAPDVTGHVLDLAAGLLGGLNTPVVDLMAGSGTTLIESAERGWSAIGVEVNPVAALYARVKMTAVDSDKVSALLSVVLADATEPSDAEVAEVFGATRNSERWFSDAARRRVTRLRRKILELPTGPERSLLFAALLSRLRRISNASARTGRLFYDPESAEEDVDGELADAVERVVAGLPSTAPDATIILSDARRTPLASGCTELSFCHPPYFALYRFSADVLRFELEVGGWARKVIQKSEVREGWKSGDPSNLQHHAADMGDVFREAWRITRPGGVFALVTSNSTLGDEQMPVIDELAHQADQVGWVVHSHLERKAHFGSASYHRSARTDKVIQRDHVLLFKRG